MFRSKSPLQDSSSFNSKPPISIEDLSQDNPSTLFYESPINKATKINITYSPSENPLSCVTSPKAEPVPLASDQMARFILDSIMTERDKLSDQCDAIHSHIEKLLNSRVSNKENFRYPRKP